MKAELFQRDGSRTVAKAIVAARRVSANGDSVPERFLDVASHRLKICHVITGLGAGGAEMALCRLLESLHAPNYEHSVIALGGEAALSARAARSAVVHHLHMRASRAGPGDILRLRRALRHEHADLVHAWMYHAHLLTTLAVWGESAPHLWSIHHSLTDTGTDKPMTRVVMRLNALFSSRPQRILYASHLSARQHEAYGFCKARTAVIPNGYDTDEFAPDPVQRARTRVALALPVDAVVVGMVARVHPTKDHANFLRAARLFLDGHPNACFVLVGDGATESNAELSRLIGAAGIGAHLRLLGRREDIPALNAAFDIATLSSRGEAFPNAIAEAMACGVPCVATNVGDVPEIVGDTGEVVPPRDAPALAHGWAKLAALDDAGRRALGLRARQHIIRHYSNGLRAHRYADLYSSLVLEH
ncbi:MAG TPA: glycosyltransferase [Rhodanobacteraceae bacterium]